MEDDAFVEKAVQTHLKKGCRKMGAKKVKGTEKKTDADPKWPTYELTYEDVVDILQIIDRSTCRELQVESGDFKLTVKKR